MRDERSDAYKAVFGPKFEKSGSDEKLVGKDVSSEPTYGIPILTEKYIITVNGVPYEGWSDLTLESGKFYCVKTEEIITNEEYSIFDFETSLV